jgi:hypothetical protein
MKTAEDVKSDDFVRFNDESDPADGSNELEQDSQLAEKRSRKAKGPAKVKVERRESLMVVEDSETIRGKRKRKMDEDEAEGIAHHAFLQSFISTAPSLCFGLFNRA